MPTTYQKANIEVVELLNEVMATYHSTLTDAGVTIDLLIAYADEESEEPAVKAHGYPAAAVVRNINLKDRVKGCADAEIVIDGDKFNEWTLNQVKALLDHELTHLELAYDKYGELKRDDLNRPKLTMRLHDRQFGWFDCVARRWGLDSFEAQQAMEMVKDWEFAQLYLPGLDPSEVGTIQKEQLAETMEADRRHNGDRDASAHRGIADQLEGALKEAGVKYVRNASV